MRINDRNSAIMISVFFIVYIISGMSVSSSLPFIQQNLAMAQIDTDNNSSTTTTPKTNTTTTAAKTVIIAKGAANPTVDLTLQKVGQWYTPKKVTVSVGDTIT